MRGVSLEGRAEVVDDPDALWAVGVSVWERYKLGMDPIPLGGSTAAFL